MQMPALLQAEIEKMLEGMPAQAVRAAAQSLSRRYRQGEKNPDGANLLRSETEIAAYAAFRMPATYAALVTALRMAEESGCGEMRTLTDVGAGSGSAYWAVREVFGEPERAVLVERENGMMALGQSLGAQGEGVLWQRGDMLTAELPKADLVTASFCLGELAPQDAERMAERLWDAAERMLLIVEPGTPAGHARIRRCIEILRERGAQMAAPCPGMGDCPLGADDWCHYAVRVERSRLHRFLKEGELPYEDEKFSFLAVTREKVHPAGARVRRRPQVRSGYVELPLCRGDRIETVKVTRKSGNFKAARKAEVGQRWEEEQE